MKNVVSTPNFEKDVEFYKRKKKYRKIDYDLEPVLIELENGNLLGDRLEGLDIPEGTAAYKVRIANSSANVGKSGGFRLLYYVAIGEDIYLLSIYSKKDDIRILNDKQLEILIKNILNDENLDENNF